MDTSQKSDFGVPAAGVSLETTHGVARNPEFGRREGVHESRQECPQVPAHKERPTVAGASAVVDAPAGANGFDGTLFVGA